MHTAANKSVNHCFLTPGACLAQQVIVCSKAINVVLDDVAAKDRMGHIVHQGTAQRSDSVGFAELTLPDFGVCQTRCQIRRVNFEKQISIKFRKTDFNLLMHQQEQIYHENFPSAVLDII